jgi:hypothetical protein
MRRTSVGIALLTYCVLVAPPARAEHTVTPPSLSPDWMGTPSKVDPESDAAKAAHSLGVTFVDALNKGDAQAVANVVNTRAFAQRIAASMYTGASQQASFVDGFMSSGQPLRRVFENYTTTLQRTHGSAKLMRVIMHAGQPRALVRVDQVGEGIEYLELEVGRDDSGAYRVIDWYQLTRGRMASDSLGAWTRLMIDPDQSFLHRLFATTPFSPELAEKFKQVSVLNHQGKFADALTILSQLPPEIADSLDVLRLRSAEAARLNNNQEYYHILDIMAAKYSNEPSAVMALIDYYINHKQFDKAHTGITVVENRVGSDGMTNMLHSNVAQQAGNYSAATAYGRKSVELEPDFRRGWFALATSYVLLKDYPGAVSAFREMQTRFGVKYSRQMFVGKTGWEGFTQSEAFKKWLPQ